MTKFTNQKRKAGFTLIEMLVAVFVFSVIMTIATGAIFNIVNANKTSQAIKSVMDNFSSALDSMSRNIRYGTEYHCGSDGASGPKSCPEGATNDPTFAFVDKNDNHVIYDFKLDSLGANTGFIEKCDANTFPVVCTRLTAPEVHIKNLHFYVSGAEQTETSQPLLLVTISGYAQAGQNKSDFNVETMVSQRKLSTCKDILPVYAKICP